MARKEWDSWVRDFQKESYEWWKVQEREKVEDEMEAEQEDND